MAASPPANATIPEYRDLIARNMSEDELQSSVIQMAHACGWLVMHTRPVNTHRQRTRKDGTVANVWETPIQGDKGFPDLVLARRGVVLHVELKTEAGGFRDGQLEWIAAIGATAGTWRPHHLIDGTIAGALA
jgi:hypothetical protein